MSAEVSHGTVVHYNVGAGEEHTAAMVIASHGLCEVQEHARFGEPVVDLAVTYMNGETATQFHVHSRDWIPEESPAPPSGDWHWVNGC